MTYLDALQEIIDRSHVEDVNWFTRYCPGLFFAYAPGHAFNLCKIADCSACWRSEYSGERVLKRFFVKPEYVGKKLEHKEPVCLDVEDLLERLL